MTTEAARCSSFHDRRARPHGASRLHIRTATERGCRRVDGAFREAVLPVAVQPLHGGVSNYSKIAFDCPVPNRTADPLTLIAEVRHEAREMLVGEASYAVEGRTGFGEFAISVCGGWQNRALGSALLSAFAIARRQPGVFWPVRRNVQDERSGEGVGAESGFVVARSDDWRATRFEKQLLDGRAS